MPYLGIFGLEILKNHCQLQNLAKKQKWLNL